MDWAQILVIILAGFLAIFLALGIVLAVMMIRITKQIKTVTNSAQRTVSSIEQLVAGISSLVRPLLLTEFIKKLIKRKR